MKKIIAIMLLASLAISATACNSKTDDKTEVTTDTAVVDTATETADIATDIELKDRWYPEFTDHLIPSTEYGELVVFKGDEIDYKYIGYAAAADGNQDYSIKKIQMYGLCTKDGKTVVDAVYSEVTKEDDGYYVLRKPAYDINEIQYSEYEYSTFFVAKTDGSSVYEHPHKAICYYYQKDGVLATGGMDGSNLIITNKDGNYANEQALLLSPIKGTAVIYNGEVYVNIDDSTDNVEYAYGKDARKTLTATKGNYKEYDFSNLKLSNNAILVGNTSKWQKLNVSGVKAIYNNEYGQDISSTNVKYGILMINSDNTLSYISIADLIEGKGNATKLDTSNVTDIVTEDHGGLDTYFITADGTKTNVNEYIK